MLPLDLPPGLLCLRVAPTTSPAPTPWVLPGSSCSGFSTYVRFLCTGVLQSEGLFAVLQEHASLLRSFSHTQAQEAMLCSSQALQALSPSACLSTQTQPYVWPVLPQLHLQSPPAVPVAAVPMAAYDLQRALGTCLLMRPREKRFILSLFTIKDQGDTHFIWRFQSKQSS